MDEEETYMQICIKCMSLTQHKEGECTKCNNGRNFE